MMDLLNRFFLAVQLARSDERGATAVEYGLIVALIAAVIVGVVATVGGQVAAAFQSLVGLF
jgi:pilus assembly protein Flp/PilA